MIEDQLIVIISAILAGLSFIAIVMPLLNRSSQKKRYKSLIEDRRRNLYQETIDTTVKGKGRKSADNNTQDSIATFYKVEKIIGETGAAIRKKLSNAGYRSATAPLVYFWAKLVLPGVFALLTYLYADKLDSIEGLTHIGVTFGAAILGFYAPEIFIKNKIDKRQQEININFPDALDMILVCVQGGISIEQSIDKISTEIADQSAILAEELALLSAEMGLLNDKRQAFADFSERVGGGAAKAFGTAMIQAEKYGTSISQAIRVMADELRNIRMATAEQKAASLPPKLTVPMILFFLPPLFVAILGPAFLQIQNME